MKKVVIVGAGLVGSLQAIYLARRGYCVDVYEKLPDIRKEKISAGRSINLAMANRGLRALKEIGVEALVKPLLIPMKGRMIHDETGKQEFQTYGQKKHEVIFSISRAGLVTVLRNQAEATGRVNFHFKNKLEHIDFNTKQLTIYDDNNEQLLIEYEYLLACDGGGSRVRRAMQSEGLTEFTADLLDHSYKELTIPPSSANTFRMNENALHIWPRGEYMLIALPNPDNSFTVTLFMPASGPLSFEQLNTPKKVKTFFQTYFVDTQELIPNLEKEFFDNPTGFLGTIRTRNWCAKDVLLLGDAAHAIVPFHGQGMNAGFEDCFVLNQYFDETRDISGSDNWSEALLKFSRTRVDDANAIADMALDNYIEMRARVRDAGFQLKKQIAFALEKRHPKTFIPRYSMVSFHHVPYYEALRRGRIQAEILEELSADIDTVQNVDFDLADKLIDKRLSPIH